MLLLKGSNRAMLTVNSYLDFNLKHLLDAHETAG